MSEKRFTFDYEYEFEIYDKQTKKHYDGRIGCQEKLVDLLNGQQATIERLQKKIDNISNSYEKFYGVKLKYAHWLQGDD